MEVDEDGIGPTPDTEPGFDDAKRAEALADVHKFETAIDTAIVAQPVAPSQPIFPRKDEDDPMEGTIE